jgi:hypothetical protein
LTLNTAGGTSCIHQVSPPIQVLAGNGIIWWHFQHRVTAKRRACPGLSNPRGITCYKPYRSEKVSRLVFIRSPCPSFPSFDLLSFSGLLRSFSAQEGFSILRSTSCISFTQLVYRNMLSLSFVLLSLLSYYHVVALNDWSVPCFDGTCSYETDFGSLKIVPIVFWHASLD